MIKIRDYRVFITIVMFIGVLCYSAYSVYILNKTSIYAENGLLENIQATCIAVALLFFLAPVFYQQRSDKLFLVFCAHVCLAIILREIDVEDFDLHKFFIFIGHGKGRNVILTLGLIAILSYAALNFSHYKNIVKPLFKRKEGTLLIITLILQLIGAFFEKMRQIPHHIYLEEVFELAGFMLILFVAFSLSSQSNKLAN
jgi:hypothetical protein